MDNDTVTTTVTEETSSFLMRNKTKIAVITTAGVCLWINRLTHAHKDEFLKEHGLYDEYYRPEEDI